MTLFEILKSVDTEEVIGDDCRITSVEIDSREVGNGSLFCALKGTQRDGHDYIENALKAGSAAILCNDLPKKLNAKVTYVKVKDTRKALEQVLNQYYDDVSSQLSLIGVTGTNGKTTVVTLLADLFGLLGYKVGLISTIEMRIGDEKREAKLTTPDIVSLHKLIREMVGKGCGYAFMEVSSHAIDQRRIGGLNFRGAVFTNISHDHLDYHKTFKNYINTKKKFFDKLGKSSFALTNIDDPNGEVMMQNTKADISRYSMNKMADFKAKLISNDLSGMLLDINGERVHVALAGRYNVYNLTAAYGVATLLGALSPLQRGPGGFKSEEILVAISRLKAPKGRFEIMGSHDTAKIIVDYSHTPDALLKILKAIQEVKRQGKILTVIGCGGDRDKQKRSKMAVVAVNYSDQAIFTSDNPRWEDPNSIINDMVKGLTKDAKNKVIEITDRRNAIKTAITMAEAHDIVLIAGKGHENYQEIKGERKPFDDAEIAREILAS